MSATIAVQRITITGIHAVLAAATEAGDTVRPGPTTFLYVVNGDTDPHTVTIDDPTTVGPAAAAQFNPDVAVVVGAGAKMFIPLPDRFADPSDGLAHVSYDDVTSVTIGAFTVPSGARAVSASGTVLAGQRIVQAGLNATFTAAAAGQKLRCAANGFLAVINGSGATKTVTLDDPTSVAPPGASAFNPDVAVVVGAGETWFVGPIDARFADPADGHRGDVSYSATTSVTVASLLI